MLPFLKHSSARHRDRWREADDRELLHGLGEDDEEAFDVLIERKTGPLINLVQRLVGDREEARDIVQLTFLRVWQHRGRYDGRFSPNTWLYRIATNLAIDSLRSRRSRTNRTEPYRRHLFHLVENRRHGEMARIERRDVARIFEELAADLTDRQRAVFLLREVEGLSSKEVGEVLGCRESTVRNHLFTARKRLRAEVARRYPEYARGRGEQAETP